MRTLSRILAGLLSLLPSAAHAIDVLNIDTTNDGGMWDKICETLPFCDVGEDLLKEIGKAVISTVKPGLAAVAIASIAYAGVKMITKGEEGYTEAKKIIITTAIAVFIGMAAIGIMEYFYEQL